MNEARLYFNGAVHTMDAAAPRADALLVRGETIEAVGPLHEVENAAGGAERLDLEGAAIVPGFIDSHCHILWYGLALQQVDVSADAIRSIADMQRRLAERAARTSSGEWVIGVGYDQNMLAEKRHPTRQDLDGPAPDHPVVVRHTSGHVLTCNRAALRLAGIDRHTPDPAGGEIDRDESGEPTGLMKESAMDLIMEKLPPPSTDIGAQAIRLAMETMATFGITSASDAATGSGPAIDPALAMFRRAADTGPLAGRITLMPQILFVAPPGESSVRTRGEIEADLDSTAISIGHAKIFSDGALSARTAALRQPYADGSANTGILLWPEPTLVDMMRRAHGAGWPIATHALGDRAVDVVVGAYEQVLRENPRSDHRHRIEHCMLLDEQIARRMAVAGIVPSLQPDIFRLGDGYVDGLGYERACESIPVGLFRRLNVPMAFSSDSPVIPCDPLPIIQSSVERRTPDGVHLGTEHAATVEEALRFYTRGSAYATHTERKKGTLRPGMLADFAVLSADPLSVPIDEFRSIRVTRTVMGGRTTYEI